MNHRARLVAYLLIPAVLAGLLFAFPSAWATFDQSQAAQTVPTATPRPPANDNFAVAKTIVSLPFSATTDSQYASTEAGEPTSKCSGSIYRTLWYAYHPATSGLLSIWAESWYNKVLAVYTGGELADLTEVACRTLWGGGRLTFQGDSDTVYYIQIGSYWDEGGWLNVGLEVAPPPVAEFWFSPYDPNTFDTVHFDNYSRDPAEVGIQTTAWDFGDGATSGDWSPTHQYAQDGDYTVKLTVTTTDGRTASITQPVPVKTHDVAITKFTAPKSASAKQTRQIVVGLNSKRYVDEVEVQLYKSEPGGYQLIGTLKQTVPVRPSNRTTDFPFSYTFTKADSNIGKVTFKAIAMIVNARDALPADNEAISAPTKVSK